jgi:hypothetical protein
MGMGMNERIEELMAQAGARFEFLHTVHYDDFQYRKFAKLIIEETLKQVDERVYGRGENSWYYDDDKRWVRLHFGYGVEE